MNTPSLPWRKGMAYGLLGAPLAFVTLPLYVTLPHWYASERGLSLQTLGLVLLAIRLLDALADPPLGWMVKHLCTHPKRLIWAMATAALMLALAFVALFSPPPSGEQEILIWLVLSLMLTFLAYSGLSLAHQIWGSLLVGPAVYRTSVVAWREGFGLAGVVLATAIPLLVGLQTSMVVLGLGLGVAIWALRSAPPPVPLATAHASGESISWSQGFEPWRHHGFRALLAVFFVSGLSSAIPATLVMFFMQDRLQASPSWQAALMAIYFLSAAASVPWWTRRTRSWGLSRSWQAGMALAIAGFIGVLFLDAGDWAGFALVCLITGWALGAELTLPSAMLAGLIQRQPTLDAGYANGWWMFCAKLNLAAAAGLTLPALQWWGYQPQNSDASGLLALSLMYGALPCALKALAWWLLQHVDKEMS